MTHAIKSPAEYCVILNNGTLIGPLQQFEQNEHWIETANGGFMVKTLFHCCTPDGAIRIVYQGGYGGCRRYIAKNNLNLTEKTA